MDDLETLKSIQRTVKSVAADPAAIAAAVRRVRSILGAEPAPAPPAAPPRKSLLSRDRLERDAPDRTSDTENASEEKPDGSKKGR